VELQEKIVHNCLRGRRERSSKRLELISMYCLGTGLGNFRKLTNTGFSVQA